MIRIRVLAPLPEILGLSETYNSIALELPVEPDASLQSLFSQLSNQYPAFGDLLDPKPGSELWGIIVTVNNKLISASEYHQTPLQDNSEVSVIPPYAGG